MFSFFQALELNPYDKNALVARSKCHLMMGNASLALKDAEQALTEDKSFIKGAASYIPFNYVTFHCPKYHHEFFPLQGYTRKQKHSITWLSSSTV